MFIFLPKHTFPYIFPLYVTQCIRLIFSVNFLFLFKDSKIIFWVRGIFTGSYRSVMGRKKNIKMDEKHELVIKSKTIIKQSVLPLTKQTQQESCHAGLRSVMLCHRLHPVIMRQLAIIKHLLNQ